MDEFRNATDDCGAKHAVDYFKNSEWIPFTTGSDFVGALHKLENLLSRIPSDLLRQDSEWSFSIFKMVKSLQKMRNESSCEFHPLPLTFIGLLDYIDNSYEYECLLENETKLNILHLQLESSLYDEICLVARQNGTG